jgi:hypothetical protein
MFTNIADISLSALILISAIAAYGIWRKALIEDVTDKPPALKQVLCTAPYISNS